MQPFSSTITTTMDRPVNLLRATTTCNSFYVFLSAAKASLLPFLTLFFRQVGLSALETGIIMAAKTLTGFVWAPLWARCAVAYNKRRVVLIFSLLMMVTMYMSFTAVYYKVGTLQSCGPASNQSQDDNSTELGIGSSFKGKSGPGVPSVETPILPDHISSVNVSEGAGTGSQPYDIIQPEEEAQGPEQGKAVGRKPLTSKNPVPSATPVTPTKSVLPAKPVTDTVPDANHINTTLMTPVHEEKTGNSSFTPVKPAAPHKTHQTTGDHHTSNADSGKAHSLSDDELNKIEEMFEKARGYSYSEIKNMKISAHTMYTMIHKFNPESDISEEEIQQIIDARNAEKQTDVKHSLHRMERSLNLTFLNNIKDKVSLLTTSLEENKLLLFVVVLLIIIFGEFFSSPVEKIADDAWFDFLERIDDMEKYGRQRYWGSLMFVLIPIVVAVVVDYTPCEMSFHTHHFLMHFYIFAGFMIFTLFLAAYFPMPPPIKQKYSSKVGKSLNLICCDARGFLFLVTLLVAGSIYASFNNFLFWHLQDLGSQEVTMGLCVAVGAFAETPMLVFSNKLVRKIGNAGLVSLSMFVMALRVLYYGFLWTPWAVLPAEVSNAFTHTALWYAVLSYDEFNVGSAMDRSIRSILSSIYFGLGFSIGSFISGLAYQEYGASVLFWGSSVVSGTWCLVFSVIHMCLPKKERVKYIKLLRKEEDESSEGEDDWLELALKEQ